MGADKIIASYKRGPFGTFRRIERRPGPHFLHKLLTKNENMNVFSRVSAKFQTWAESHPVMGMIFIVIVMVAMAVVSNGGQKKHCGEWKKRHRK